MAKRQKQQEGERPWRNRIVRTGTLAASQFLANEANWRIHPKEQQEAIRRVIGVDVGWVQSVIVNLRTSKRWPAGQRNVETLVDGHDRVQQALRKGDDEPVPVTYVDLDPAEEKLVLATFDPIGQLAVEDTEKLVELQGDLQHHADLLALVAGERLPGATPAPAKAKGLRHTVHECRCCSEGKCDDPQCGCYEGAE